LKKKQVKKVNSQYNYGTESHYTAFPNYYMFCCHGVWNWRL